MLSKAAMDLMTLLMNIVFPPLALLTSVVVLPLYLAFKFLSFIKRCSFSESVAGKVVLVTGAGAGLGKQIAYEYAKRGARLALVDIKEDNLTEVSRMALYLGSPDVITIRANISLVEDCKRFVNATMDHFGQLDHLVNNAGIVKLGLLENIEDMSQFITIMDTNFWGSVYTTKLAIPYLRKSKGKIIVIASAGGWFYYPRLSFYTASKAALIGFFETLRAEVGSEIGITIVAPGLINTDMAAPYAATEVPCFIPMASVETIGKEIVKKACRGDRYTIEPFWMRVVYLYTVLFPDLVAAITHQVLKLRQQTQTSELKHAP